MIGSNESIGQKDYLIWTERRVKAGVLRICFRSFINSIYLGGSMREISLEALGFCQVTKGGYQRKTMVP